jgi:hypothetical protein
MTDMELYIEKYSHLQVSNADEMTAIYRSLQIDYPKFHKMDNLSKLGFLASEQIFKDLNGRYKGGDNLTLAGFNSSSSLDADAHFQATIDSADNYFPSPSIFVYTLPNVVLGEIAIRNCLFGETIFYICARFDARFIIATVRQILQHDGADAVLAGWIEYGKSAKEALMLLINKDKGSLPLSENILTDFINNNK